MVLHLISQWNGTSLPPEPVFKTWDSKCLALIAQMVRAFGVNPEVGGSSPSQVETFSVSKNFWLFHKNIPWGFENECCCPHTVNISNVNFTSKIYKIVLHLIPQWHRQLVLVGLSCGACSRDSTGEWLFCCTYSTSRKLCTQFVLCLCFVVVNSLAPGRFQFNFM